MQYFCVVPVLRIVCFYGLLHILLVLCLNFGCMEYISIYTKIIYLMMLLVAHCILLNDRVISEYWIGKGTKRSSCRHLPEEQRNVMKHLSQESWSPTWHSDHELPACEVKVLNTWPQYSMSVMVYEGTSKCSLLVHRIEKWWGS